MSTQPHGRAKPTQPAQPGQPSRSTSTRLTWIDTVKGLAIILVVLYHADSLTSGKSWETEHLGVFTSALFSVRMPLFFAMSGFFVLRRIDRPWSWQLRNRIGPFLWLFVLWTVLWLLAFVVIPWDRTEDYDLYSGLRLFIDPSVGPWYIYALAIYFVIAKLIHPLPVWAQLCVGAVISLPVALGFVSVDVWAWDSLISHFLAFQIGVLGTRWFTRVAERSSVWRLLLYGAVWAAGAGAMYFTDTDLSSVWRLPLTVFGMAMGVTAAALLARYAPWSRLDWIGRNTLPIYLLHVPIIGLVYSIDLDLPANPVTGIGIPLLATVVAVLGALAIWRVTRSAPGVFTAPWTGDGANTRTASRAPTPTEGTRRQETQPEHHRSPRQE